MNMASSAEKMTLRGLRGATTCEDNSIPAIETSVKELISELTERNQLSPDAIISMTFSVTTDLNACFPAAVARRQGGWDEVALLDCQQMAVPGDLKRCIRILAYAWLPDGQVPQHPYLGEATILRPDRSGMS